MKSLSFKVKSLSLAGQQMVQFCLSFMSLVLISFKPSGLVPKTAEMDWTPASPVELKQHEQMTDDPPLASELSLAAT